MIGSLANMAILVTHGNAILKNGHQPLNLDQHGAFKFYEWIHFRHVGKDEIFATSPNEYVNGLRARGIRGLLLTYGANTQLPEGISERMSAGFVGGGKQYLLQEFTDLSVNYLALSSELGDRERPDQRIWRDTHQLFSTVPRQVTKPDRPDLEWTAKKLSESLLAAIRFCEAGEEWLKSSHWPEVFKTALGVLNSGTPLDSDHYLAFPQQVMSENQNRLLRAADSAWVFGGMGSWNDLGFESESQRAEYEVVSNRLYQAVNLAITNAVNASSPVFDLPPLTTPLSHPPGNKPWWKFW